MAKTMKWYAVMRNTVYTKDRMLQDFDFPIAFNFGTRDFLGSAEGANTIVRNNKYFK